MRSQNLDQIITHCPIKLVPNLPRCCNRGGGGSSCGGSDCEADMPCPQPHHRCPLTHTDSFWFLMQCRTAHFCDLQAGNQDGVQQERKKKKKMRGERRKKKETKALGWGEILRPCWNVNSNFNLFKQPQITGCTCKPIMPRATDEALRGLETSAACRDTPVQQFTGVALPF